MRKGYFFLLIVFVMFLGRTASSQIVMEGVVVNKETKLPIANVNITTQDKRIGTSSDSRGRFSLRFPRSYDGKWIHVSAVGYFKDSVRVEGGQDVTVALAPQVYTLKEVYVMPDSTLLTLLRRAYRKIPENYPTVPTMSEGFYRESAKNNSEEQADFIEAILSVYKDAYDKPTRSPGQIEILKSRKRKIRNTGILYYGGAFVPINDDVVLNRAGFLSPRHFKKYRYKFEGIKALGDDEFYEVSFMKTLRDSSLIKGTMMIDKENLAYVSFEIEEEYASTHSKIKYRKYKTSIRYEKEDSWWHLKYYTTEREDIKRNDSLIFGSLDYVTTTIKTDSVKPIPYERRLRYVEPVIFKTEEYDEKGWTDYDDLKHAQKEGLTFQFSPEESAGIFKQGSMSEMLLSEEEVQTMKKDVDGVYNTYKFISRFTWEIGFVYQRIRHDGGFADLGFSPDANSSFAIKRNIYPNEQKVLFQERMGFRVNKNVEVFLYWAGDLMKIGNSSNALGMEYRKNIKNRGLPLFFCGALSLASNDYFVNLGTYESSRTFRIKGKKFNSDKIQFGYGVREYAIAPQIALSYQIGKRMELKLHGMYQYEFKSQDKFKIRERTGLFRKSVTIDADDSRLEINHDDDLWRSIRKDRFQVGLSLRLAY